MKVARLETFPVRVPYKHTERSSLIARGGVTDVIVKLTMDDGLVGWGECTRAADVPGIESAVKAMAPLVLGRDPWDKEAIHRDLAVAGLWAFQPMTGNFAFAGIDMALWDACGKEAQQPLYRLFGGAVRETVDYFYYMRWGTPEEIKEQAEDGVRRGYSVFYIKAGVDGKAEEAMLEALREAIGPERKIRIDVNQAWTLPQAERTLARWHPRFDLDFVEAPVAIDPVENMRDLRARSNVALCANEGLWREADAYRLIKSRCADYLCFSPYWVGSLGRFHALVRLAEMEGQRVCKHTHGELGLAAAAGQHMMLAAANACDGHQQTAQMMEDDIVKGGIPIAEGPSWGRIDGAGLGVEVDEEKLMTYHQEYRRHGTFAPYGDKFARREA
ncbi:MAG: mandelate racemase/muconate lactonizing enzyme family protein [Alphaproteobacteria bacterium]|nr:mandelate racemase/muconate lactonizing enzyme family protein [Alphaproteobacteria bacterium]